MPRPTLLALLALLAAAAPARAQSGAFDPRFGVGFDGLLSIGSGAVLDDGLGLGVRGRASFPLNADFSLGLDVGFAGFVLGGREGATYLFNPQISGILTLPRLEWAKYVIGGFGGFFPMGDARAEGGPSIHLGLGWALPLQETSFYFEIDPSLIIGANRSAIVVPARVGVIF